MLRFISTNVDSILSTWHELRARVILGKLVRGEEKKVVEGGGGETPPGPAASDPHQRGSLERSSGDAPRAAGPVLG